MVTRDIEVDKVRKNFYITLVVLITALTVTYIYTRPLKVVEVRGGPLLVLNNGEEICLAGVEGGAQAETFMKGTVGGKEVRLEYERDRVESGRKACAYVYLLDGTFLNAEVVRQGYARSDTMFPFKYQKEFEHYEQEAREKKRGMWADRTDKNEVG